MSSFGILNTKQNCDITKKIIALTALLALGVGFSANAQQKKVTPKAATTVVALPTTESAIAAAAKKNVATLNGVIALKDNEKQMFQGLFETKYKMLNRVAAEGNKEEAKQQVYTSIDGKLRAYFKADSMALLEAKPAILKELTHE